MIYAWLIAIAAFAIIEICTTQLVSIWFAGGALAAFIGCLAGADETIQWTLFIVCSAVLLLATKPLVKKLTENKREKTNVDAQIGKATIVTQKIDNLAETGEVRLGGLVWTARSAFGEIIDENEKVIVVRVEGVKLIVKRCPAPIITA